jgi:hypothetical protein
MKIVFGIALVFLIIVLLFIGISQSNENKSLAGVEKAVNFLLNSQFNQSLGLCREAPNVAPNVYWLVSDNLWAWKALEMANESGLSNAAEAGATAEEIKIELTELAANYGLPTDSNGLPISHAHEAVIGDVALPPYNTSVAYTLYKNDYVMNMTLRNGTTIMGNWAQYADLLLYAALSCHWEGNNKEALGYYQKATQMWIEADKGVQDITVKETYDTYKVALLLYTSRMLGKSLVFESELVNKICSQQNESNGGIVTNYYGNGTWEGDANTETTSIAIIALLTPPRARLGTFAFYYPWYGTPDVSGNWSHWNEGNSSGQIPHDPNITLIDGRRDIAAEDYPLLGAYDSNNKSVIEQHIEWAREANISCFIISWWGQGSFEDKALFSISKVCDEKKFNYTVYIENTSSYYQKPPSINQTIDDLTYLLNKYNNSRSWYRIDDRPVIFVYSQARDNLSPQAWNWHACPDSIGNDIYPTKIENASTQWLPSEEVRKPARHGIIPIQPFQNTSGYIVSANPINLEPNEEYWVNFGISDIRNDSKIWSDVGMRIKIGLDPMCNDTLYDQIVNFTDGWIDLSRPINMTRYAGKAVYLKAESYNGGQENWSSEWAAVDYLFINNSEGEIISQESFFDNGWNAVVRQIRQNGAFPYVIMDFGGFYEKIDGFLDYFQNCVDGVHAYNPTDYNESVSQVLDIYNIASESAYSRNMSFVATVVPGFNNTAVQNESRVIDRRDGSYYGLYWLVAKACSPDGYAITSFNEWHEGTEIEPSREYGYQYLSLTRYNAIPEFPFTVLPLFMVTSLFLLFTRKLLARACAVQKRKRGLCGRKTEQR